MYSTVDMSQITDTGPSIMVVCGETGKKAPLERVEQELDKFTTPPQQQQQQQLDSSTNSKTSIAELVSGDIMTNFVTIACSCVWFNPTAHYI